MKQIKNNHKHYQKLNSITRRLHAKLGRPVAIATITLAVIGMVSIAQAVKAIRVADPTYFERGIVTISFVNGYSTQAEAAATKLATNGIGATFYVPTNDVGQPNKVKIADLRNLHKQGFEIGNITAEDEPLKLNQREIFQRYKKSQGWFESNVGVTPTTCYYPGGHYGNDPLGGYTLPAPLLNAVSDTRLGFKGCAFDGQGILFKHSYSNWKVKTVTIDESVSLYDLTHLLNNVAGAQTWVNFRVVQIDERFDDSQPFTTSETFNGMIDHLVWLRDTDWIYTARVDDALEIATR